jgi:hypothetical protein
MPTTQELIQGMKDLIERQDKILILAQIQLDRAMKLIDKQNLEIADLKSLIGTKPCQLKN